MQTRRMILSVVALTLISFASVAPAGAGDGALVDQMRQQFPRLAKSVGLDGSGNRLRVSSDAQAKRVVQAFAPARFDAAYRLDNGAERVSLRPLHASASAAVRETGAVAYSDGFRGIDVIRSSHYEVLRVRDAAALRGLSYHLADAEGISAVVPDGRAVRFLALRPGATARERQLSISAPLVIDAVGRPSLNARWVIDNAGTRAAALRIELDDPYVTFPIAVAYAPGTVQETRAATSAALSSLADRNLRVRANASGAITGTVTDSDTSAGIAFEVVDVYDSNGEYFGSGFTDETGFYILSDLPTGSYRAFVAVRGYEPEVYNNIVCLGCDIIATGTPIGVTDGATTENIDFALSSGATRISGTVRNNAGAPLAAVGVAVYAGNGAVVGYGESGETGTYRIVLSTGGAYYARTHASIEGYVDQLHSGIDCSGCNPATGTAINVSTGSSVSNIDFALKSNGGRIAGRFTDSGSLAPVTVGFARIYNSSGVEVTFGHADANGDYVTFHGLAAGQYYVAGDAFGYSPEVYNNLPCTAACVPTSGTAVNVSIGATSPNVNFGLAGSVARVSGVVSAGDTNLPLEGVYIYFYDSTGDFVEATATNDAGVYSIILPTAGTYYARTSNSIHGGYNEILYNGILCAGCNVTSGNAIQVIAGTEVTGVNFTLTRSGGTIAGSILSGASQPIPNAYVLFYDSTGVYRTFGVAAANGNYTSFHLLAAGNYYAVAAADGYETELYNNIPCTNGCTPTTGTAIAVTNGSTTSSINFLLNVQTCGGMALTPDSVPDSSLNAQYSATFTATNAVAPVTYSVTQGSLPAGLALDGASGGLSGTTTAGGTFTFVIRAVDANSCTVSRSYTIDVGGLPSSATISASVTTITLGQSVTLSGTVSPTAATGFLTFLDNDSPVSAPIALVSSAASATATPISAGAHAMTAFYGGDTTYQSATSAAVIVTVLKGTPAISWATPAPIVYGAALSAVELNATANVPGTFVYNPPLGTILDAGPQLLTVHFTPEDTANYNDANGSVTLTVNKANQTINWPSPAPITYPTALSGTQLNATVSVPGPSAAGALTYSPAAGTVLNAGTNTLTVSAAATNNYNAASESVSLTVNRANQTISWSAPANIVYGTALSSTQLNATVAVPGPSAAGALTYDPAAGTVLNAGTHTLSVNAAETVNYNSANASVSITVLKATPVFSNLSSPTIVVGTASTVVSGKIASGTFVPPGSVTITVNGVAVNATIQANQTFSASVATAALPIGTHPIAFAYAGSANFNPATGASTLTVAYAHTGGPTTTNPANAGSTVVIRVQIRNAAGQNVSSDSISLTPVGISSSASGPWNAAPVVGEPFRFQTAQGGQYQFNLKTPSTLTTGTYYLGFTIAGDPTIHAVSFTIR